MLIGKNLRTFSQGILISIVALSSLQAISFAQMTEEESRRWDRREQSQRRAWENEDKREKRAKEGIFNQRKFFDGTKEEQLKEKRALEEKQKKLKHENNERENIKNNNSRIQKPQPRPGLNIPIKTSAASESSVEPVTAYELPDRIQLKDGSIIECRIFEHDDKGVWVEIDEGAKVHFENHEIQKIIEQPIKKRAFDETAKTDEAKQSTSAKNKEDVNPQTPKWLSKIKSLLKIR